jgi:ferric-dicitrate binding protein FerR (iron transport regulator)
MDDERGREGGERAEGAEEAVMRTLLRAGDPGWPAAEPARGIVRAHWRAAVGARRRRRRALLALAATLLVALGVGVFRVATRDAPAVDAPPRVATMAATVERVVAAGGADEAPQPLRVAGAAVASGALVRVGDSVETPAGVLAALRVAGSSLRLDEGTRLVMAEPAVVRLERGAVYVDSPDGATGGGVVVVTPFGRVVEIGTQFEVRLEGRALRLRVRDGAVELQGAADGRQRVEKGTELLVRDGGKLERNLLSPAAPSWGWVSRTAPVPPLEGSTLAELLQWVGRETGTVVTFVDPSEAARAGEVVLHGPLEELDPVQAVAVVLPTCGLRGRFEGDQLWIEAQP